MIYEFLLCTIVNKSPFFCPRRLGRNMFWNFLQNILGKPGPGFSVSQSLVAGVTHSICTLEFENHRALYDWFLETWTAKKPGDLRPLQYGKRGNLGCDGCVGRVIPNKYPITAEVKVAVTGIIYTFITGETPHTVEQLTYTYSYNH